MIAQIHLRIRAWRKRWKSNRRGEAELSLLPLFAGGGTAIDVGANKGVYTYFLSKLCTRIIAYEANPDLVNELHRYKLPGLDVRPYAVSDSAGEAAFYIPVSGKGKRHNNIAGLDRPDRDVDEIRVKCIRLDDEDLTDISFIKIDVEGHELNVLRGAEQMILRDQPTLLVEINGGPQTAHASEVFALLESWNYIPLQYFRGRLFHYSMLPDEGRRPRDRNYICLPANLAEPPVSQA